jgi:purine-nucleoside phosphorylase
MFRNVMRHYVWDVICREEVIPFLHDVVQQGKEEGSCRSNMKRPTDAIMVPRRVKGDPVIGPRAIMVAMEKDLGLMRRLLEMERRRASRILSSRLYQGVCGGQEVALVGPMCGAPYSVLILEKLIALGVEQVLFFGWCGSIQRNLPVGAFLVPDRAISEEGTSAHYPVGSNVPRPSGHLFRAIEEGLVEWGVPFSKGPVWTTDAPYRETREKVVLFQGQGVLGVEMEVSALFTVAAFRQVDLGALLVVSDDLSCLQWKPGFSHMALAASRKIAAQVLCALLEKMTDSDSRAMGP